MGEACWRVVEPTALEEVLEVAHDALEKWGGSLAPLFERDPAPTLSELSELFQKSRAELFGAILQAAVEKLYAKELERVHAPCPCCNQRVRRKRLEKKALSTLHGSFELERPYFYCKRCSHGFAPLDDVLGIADGHHQYDIQSRAVPLAADVVYSSAQKHFESLSGVALSDHALHDIVQAVGESATLEDVVPSVEEIEARIEQAAQGRKVRPVLVATVDGAFAPIRPPGGRKETRGKGDWREVKGIRLYLLDKGMRIIPVVSWHQVENAEKIRKDLETIVARIPRDKVRIALIGDGADWVWNTLESAFPDAEEILDYYHCAEHLTEMANEQFTTGLRAREWVETVLTHLAQGEVDLVIAALILMTARNKDAAEKIESLRRYLSDHCDRVDFGRAKRRGMPRGSGAMESANKFICHTRLKRSGAWWLEENCNAMLRIRCAIYNGTFDRVFRAHVDRERAQRSATTSE